MSRNRAEAIVRGVGALFLILLLGLAALYMPQILKGKSTGEMMQTLLLMLGIIVLPWDAATTVGLIV